MEKKTDLQQFIKKFDEIPQEELVADDQFIKSTTLDDNFLRPTNSEIFSIIVKFHIFLNFWVLLLFIMLLLYTMSESQLA